MKKLLMTMAVLFSIFLSGMTAYAAEQSFETHTIQKINMYRVGSGMKPLYENESLKATSSTRARECATLFSHTRPDGSVWYTAGNGDSYGETLAKNISDSNELVDRWMKSPSHRAVLMDSHYSTIAVSAYRSESGFFTAAEFA